MRHLHVGQELVVLRQDLAHGLQIAGLKRLLHLEDLGREGLEARREELRIAGLLLVDELVQGRGIDGDAAIGQDDLKRLWSLDPGEMLLSVFEPEQQQPAIGRGGVVDAARDAVLGELAQPGYPVDLLNRTAQVEFFVQCSCKRNATSSAGAHPTSSQ